MPLICMIRWQSSFNSSNPCSLFSTAWMLRVDVDSGVQKTNQFEEQYGPSVKLQTTTQRMQPGQDSP